VQRSQAGRFRDRPALHLNLDMAGSDHASFAAAAALATFARDPAPVDQGR
jgi:hypothetical protein